LYNSNTRFPILVFSFSILDKKNSTINCWLFIFILFFDTVYFYFIIIKLNNFIITKLNFLFLLNLFLYWPSNLIQKIQDK
jgi:accessory gene regulator protein AgrB